MSREMPRRADDAAWRMVDGEMIVVSASRGSILALNPTAALVWERADGTVSVDDLARGLAEEYEIDPAAAAADIDEFLDELRGEGLLREEGAD